MPFWRCQLRKRWVSRILNILYIYIHKCHIPKRTIGMIQENILGSSDISRNLPVHNDILNKRNESGTKILMNIIVSTSDNEIHPLYIRIQNYS